jgi:hypothetical protein
VQNCMMNRGSVLNLFKTENINGLTADGDSGGPDAERRARSIWRCLSSSLRFLMMNRRILVIL